MKQVLLAEGSIWSVLAAEEEGSFQHTPNTARS